MKNNLIDVSIKTMIGMLPEIINSNNEAIDNEFSEIYNSDTDKLIKSVDVPDGTVNAGTGSFLNVSTNSLGIYDISAFELSVMNKVNHNTLINRYYNVLADKTINNILVGSDLLYYTHNTGSIVHTGNYSTGMTLSDIIDKLISNNKSVMNTNMVYGVSTVNELVLSNPNSYTLDNSVLFANKTLLMKLKLHPWQYLDIADGVLYTYYDYNHVLVINDEYPASISGTPGSIVSVKFEDKKKKGFYKIILSRKNKTSLRIGKDELIRLKLVCIANDNVYGTEWDIESYSVRNPEDISIIKK